jgi:hypothetical protein
MTVLPESDRAVVESGRLAHVVTLNAEGSPQLSCAWIAMDGDELGRVAGARDGNRTPHDLMAAWFRGSTQCPGSV